MHVHRPSPPAPHRPCPLLRRQRPAVGVLLSQRLRLRRGRLRRPGNASTRTRPATSCGRATSPSSSPRRCGPSHPEALAPHPPRRRRAGHRPRSRRRARPPTTRAVRRGAVGVIGPTPAGRRVRRLRIRHHPHLRRHDAQLRQPRPLSRRLRPRLQAARPGAATARAPSAPPASRPSTTSSATSKKARWTSGSRFYENVLGFSQLDQLRRQGHQHRVLGPDVEGGAGRHRPDQVSDQRAGQERSGVRRSRSI